jgi:hypothetical protein
MLIKNKPKNIVQKIGDFLFQLILLPFTLIFLFLISPLFILFETPDQDSYYGNAIKKLQKSKKVSKKVKRRNIKGLKILHKLQNIVDFINIFWWFF